MMLYVALAFAGLVVLGGCAIKVSLAVRGLGREVRRTRARLETEHARLTREMGRRDRVGE
jgi:hypothetical protein